MKKVKSENIIRVALSFALFLGSFSFLSILLKSPVNAAGVALTVTAPTNAEFPASTATNVTFRYDPSASEFAIGNTITVTVTPAVAAALVNCTPTATTDLDNDTTPDGAFGSLTTTGAVYTLSAATTTATTTFATMCLRFPATTAVGIYSISFTDTNDNDFGAALVYVGDDNDVTVTAAVTPLLSFAIRNSADTADTNVCPLGVLTAAAVSECEYRLKVNTNSASGYTVQITSDGDLSRSGPGAVADSEDIDPIGEAVVTAGTEGYGIEFNGGAATVGSITEEGNFSDDDSSVPTSPTNLYTSDGPNNPSSTDTTNTALVTHRATVDAGTGTGNYTQIVTYYASASF